MCQKFVLKKELQKYNLNYEELQTVLQEVKATVNNSPLCIFMSLILKHAQLLILYCLDFHPCLIMNHHLCAKHHLTSKLQKD